MQDIQIADTSTFEEGKLPVLPQRFTLVLRLKYWNSRCKESVNGRILSAMLVVGAMTLMVKLVSTAKEMVIAHEFGVGDGLDAFLIAFLLPSVAINVVAGSFNVALIPTYIEVRDREGKQAAQRLFSSIMICGAMLLVAVSILIAFIAPSAFAYLASGFSPDKVALTRNLFFVLLPLLPLSGVFVTWAAVLNAGERFALPAITPIVTPLAVILLVASAGRALGIYAFAIAVIAGSVLEGIVLARGLLGQGISVVPRWHGFSPATKQVMKQYAPMILGGCLMSSTGLVDQAMAAMLRAGSVSILNYGNKVSSVVIGLCSIALSTAVLPQFSRMVAAGDWSGIQNTLKTYTRLALVTTIPLTLLLVAISRFLVSLLFQHGAFTESNTIDVASVQSLYILQLPFYVTGMLFVRLISALKANHILMWGTTISFTLNITLDYVFMKWLGVGGIALSTSVVYLASFCYLGFMSTRVLRRAECV